MKTLLHKERVETLVRIPINNIELEGELVIPPNAKGLVIFAHGSGSSRHSPRNQFVAKKLQTDTLATLLVDLLSEVEDIDYQARFDIGLLTERLVIITDWVAHDDRTNDLGIGYFGASTGAAAAMLAAKGAEDTIMAIVSRGGRVDLAEATAKTLKVPTLLIVGRDDYGVLEANNEVFLKLRCKKELAVIPKATHLFEEPGTLERVADLAANWFRQYLYN
jgi:pimeloyl-ACP methyl ester carboxylesterase